MTSPERMPPELESALAEHPDAEALAALWGQLPRGTPAPNAGESPAAAAQRRDQAYARLSARLGLAPDLRADAGATEARTARVASAAPASRSRGWLRVAAAVALLLGGAAAWQLVPVTYAVAVGAAPEVVTLADGSRVTLAAGSSVRHARGFRSLLASSERRVALDGDAFFDVAKDGRPFIVSTADATVRVLGTRFEVRAARAGRGTQVAVEEGHVGVRGLDAAAAPVELRAGHVAAIGPDGAAARRRDLAPERVASWRSGGLAIEDESLPGALADLSRRYGVEITLGGAVDEDASVTLYYPSAPAIERVLADLAAARGLRWERTSRGFALSNADPR